MKMKEHHCIMLIFGATGDLAKRKLLPALYYLEKENQLKQDFKVVCIARKEKTHEIYRNEASGSIRQFSRIKTDESILKKLISRIYYLQLEFSKTDDYAKLKKFVEIISGGKCSKCERIFYLAVTSSFFGPIINNLKRHGLAKRQSSAKAYNRVMFEKPFGHDLESARGLNKSITEVFHEKQIYRIDHYMAKELVQNLLVLRFANSIFEPLWNKKYIDHVQITVAETLGIEGRANYYDNAGALRDVMQNHMMQLLTLVAMEAPKSIKADDIKDKKVKVLKSILKFVKNNIKRSCVIGQYEKGEIDGKKVVDYREENGISPSSNTETYAALKMEINNRMWKNVPFYLRTGKRLKDKSTEIVVVYKKMPLGLFKKQSHDNNQLVIRVQPYEGITLQFNAKVPGSKVIIDNVDMDFCHECTFGANTPEAYERLLYDIMAGDQTLFTGWEEVESAWKAVDPLIKFLKDLKLHKYKAGTWGPKEADRLIEKDKRKWVEPKRPAYAELLGK
ncbi:MAG: glucose-6-phosphate dehydrogenase [Nanoarchaeota archaeon]|nr:glucose-6-phosphate dehydrogenase [Nanoarchaeota archaeon]